MLSRPGTFPGVSPLLVAQGWVGPLGQKEFDGLNAVFPCGHHQGGVTETVGHVDFGATIEQHPCKRKPIVAGGGPMQRGFTALAVGDSDITAALAARQEAPEFIKNWTMADFGATGDNLAGRPIMRGMKAYMAARCNQCHAINGHGSKLGPDLTKVRDKFTGRELLRQILEPSSEINKDYRAWLIETKDEDFVVGTIVKEDNETIYLVANQLMPKDITVVRKTNIKSKELSPVSAMPAGLTSTLTQEQVLDLLAFLEAGGYQLPKGLQHKRR